MKWRIFCLVLVLLVLVGGAGAAYYLWFSGPPPLELQDSLVLYCAEPFRDVLEPVAKHYEREHQIAIELHFGSGGGFFHEQVTTGGGDLILPEGAWTITDINNSAAEQRPIAEVLPLASAQAMLLLSSSESKEYESLSELLADEVELALPDPAKSELGRAIRRQIGETQWGRLWKKKAVAAGATAEIIDAVRSEKANVGIVWQSRPGQFAPLKTMQTSELQTVRHKVALGVLRTSSHPTTALHFARFVAARDRGLPVFQQAGFHIVSGDAWAHRPQLRFYSSPLFRPIFENKLQAFEHREGCLLEVRFADSLAIVEMIDAGTKPDVLLTADDRTAQAAEKQFDTARELTRTGLVLATPAGNPRNITGLSELSRTALRVGMCNPETHALGEQIRVYLVKKQIYELIKPNLRYQPDTSEDLVAALVAADLDVALLYEAEVGQARSQLTIVEPKQEIQAAQFLSVRENSDFRHLSLRFIDFLSSSRFRTAYKNHGLRWQPISPANNGGG